MKELRPTDVRAAAAEQEYHDHHASVTEGPHGKQITKLKKPTKSPFNYINPLPVETSFREIYRDFYDVDFIFSKVLKEIANNSYSVSNFFELSVVDQYSNCKLIRNEFGGLSDLVIPLAAVGSVHKARLIITGIGDVSIQIKYAQDLSWGTFPVKTNQVKKVINRIIPTVLQPNCPVE